MIFAFLKHIKVLVGLYLAVIAVFIYLGYTYYLDSRLNELNERSKELSSISNLKYNAILNWFEERRSDAEFLFYNQPLQCLIDDYIRSGSVSDSARIVGMISTMYKNHDYSNILVRSHSGNVIVNLNPGSDIFFFTDSLNSSIKSEKIVFSDIYPDSINHKPAMDSYIPVICNGNFVAMIIIKIELERLLYPIISSWYVDNSSGEALIVKAEKDSIVSLSPLKYSDDKKVFIKRSINDENLPVAKAIRGAVDIVEGVDYRGKKVLADVKSIEKLNWYLVTKIDLSEVYAPVNEQTLTNLFILGLITFLGGLALLYYHTKLNYNHLKKVSDIEQKLKDILDYSTNAFYSHTTDHKLTYMSHQSSEILGYSPEELKMKWTELITDNPINIKGIELTNLAIQTGKTQQPYELELFKKNGEKVWVEVREAPVLKNGKTISIVGALTDITKRKHAEEELKILSKAIEQSPVSVIITNPDGNIQYVNQAFTDVSGYSLEEIYGKNPRILKSGNQSEEIYKDLWNTILKGRTWQGELQNKKKNGELFWESVTISPIISENGKVTNFIAIKDDITEKKKNEEVLRENEEKFRLIFDNSSEALFLSWPDGKIEAANPAACRMFGYSLDELIRLGRDAIIDQSDDRFERISKERLEYGSVMGEVPFKRKSGEKFIGELSSSLFKDKDGNFRISTIVRDITERKKIEQAIIEAKEKAEEASHIKSNFLATMSHELRTPLVGILGYAELLSAELKNKEQAEMAHTILLSGNRLLETLNSILDISRIEANKLEYTETSINLIEVLNESVNLFKPVALDKKLFLRSSFPKATVLVNSDKDLLLKIFNNLISNSVKYTRNGGVEVTVKIETNQSTTYALTEVKDTGIGISSEYHDIVFEPFRQVSEGMARVFDGTGLGLAITKRLVEILNGEIYFESMPGEGTTFYVKFPVHSENSDGEVKTDSKLFPDEKINPEEIELDKLILLVEDDISNALMIKTYIQDYFNVDHVLNGFDAIQKCTLRKYDAILMDINLKGIDGVETFRRIRELDDYYSQIPSIAITAYAMKGDREKFLASGFNYYIPKPFKHSELLNVLFKIFK